ncbi:MAG: DUF72 domain-containing protein [Spirochaetia bacterium]|nr:DUF72 domain-containing protein [Spirochaetia bacterium]
MATILIGTSGYSYNEWVGPVYPSGTRQDQFLSLYATQFSTVELNFSYYKMPEKKQLQMMKESTPSSFGFSIKGHESLTHTIDIEKWKEDAHTFIEAIEPLVDEGRLEAILLQFPYSFHYEVNQRRYLDALLREFSPFPLAVEFRNSMWYNSRTIEALSNRNVAFTSLDLPQTKGTPPMMDVHTSPIAYVRLHGRNGDSWWGSDAASRYDYLYSTKELEAIAARIKTIGEKSKKVLVYFNNHRRGQAANGAKELMSLLCIKGSV